MQNKKIIILLAITFLLTGCTLNLKKVIPGAGKTTESQKDASTMSLDEMEKELKGMDDLNVDNDLGEIDKEL